MIAAFSNTESKELLNHLAKLEEFKIDLVNSLNELILALRDSKKEILENNLTPKQIHDCMAIMQSGVEYIKKNVQEKL
jgi:hypothetical protein